MNNEIAFWAAYLGVLFFCSTKFKNWEMVAICVGLSVMAAQWINK